MTTAPPALPLQGAIVDLDGTMIDTVGDVEVALGLKLACLTNKPTAFARPLLAAKDGTASSARCSAAMHLPARSLTRCRFWKPAARWAASQPAR